MDPTLVRALTARSARTERRHELSRIWTPVTQVAYRAGHAYVHPTAICPVACRHCMYGSNLETTASLDVQDARRIATLLENIEPTKLTLSGGGEPFVRLPICLALQRASSCRSVEYVTAGNWAGSRKGASAALRQICAARPSYQSVVLRVSVDSFHWSAPRPVTMEHYGNILEAYRESEQVRAGVELTFRSLLRERQMVEERFRASLGALVERTDDWNSRLTFSGGIVAAITYNVMRFSGAARENGLASTPTDVSVTDYYAKFAGLPDLNVATSINDASRGNYERTANAAFTFDSDRTYFIFGASPGDWRASIDDSLEDSIAFFSIDPLTRLALRSGPIAALKLLSGLNDVRQRAVLDTQDIASFMQEGFASPVEAATCRVLALRELQQLGDVARVADDILRLPTEPVALMHTIKEACSTGA